MELPKFLLCDNTDYPEDIFILHIDFPRFIINLKDDKVELLESVEAISKNELDDKMDELIDLANEFYDRELERYE
ncbi:MAG: hypothetical protein EAZ27_07975 [Cytophagales bacterium]|nr:MAG: hypothetical protein EAZ27_07975 [Cytophagales bacterium]